MTCRAWSAEKMAWRAPQTQLNGCVSCNQEFQDTPPCTCIFRGNRLSSLLSSTTLIVSRDIIHAAKLQYSSIPTNCIAVKCCPSNGLKLLVRKSSRKAQCVLAGVSDGRLNESSALLLPATEPTATPPICRNKPAPLIPLRGNRAWFDKDNFRLD